MQVTFDLPDDFVAQLHPLEDKLPQILELGLRELNAIGQSEFSGVAEVLEFLTSLPTPEAIIALRPSKTLQAQISALLEKNHTVGLTPTEEQLWQGYQYLEHIVRMAKARAFVKLKEVQGK
ncbi:hypothetical protein WA1_34715 [Scytonema hofmannii PCC 7110]|uniref:Uncharacterized protein n=1 Tax=Scytonema hofmannii PCC 7110 TaxID=128403 RepID=A0A139X344_9CYAN|nr:hypothetical protein [Scytonema hofmannii]KYC39129.1 hypothetical protein WA1_34715 [Scytonema hofmannii PCC 7110]